MGVDIGHASSPGYYFYDMGMAADITVDYTADV
jgi:hypothetical protein